MINTAPIVLFVYNRPWHTRQTLETLAKNRLADQSKLIIYSDGAKNQNDLKAVKEVRDIIRNITSFKDVKIIERSRNFGLANSIITGVSEVIDQYGWAIILEDDMLTSPFFLQYMNEALTFYQHEEKVISIHGYFYPVDDALPETFFLKGADCWGWGTWKRGWNIFNPDARKLLSEIQHRKLKKEFDINGSFGYTKMLSDNVKGKNDSWAIRWYASAFLANKLTLYPIKSMVKNIGMDQSGVHCKTVNDFDVQIQTRKVHLTEIPLEENALAKKSLEKFFRNISPSIIQQIIKLVSKI